MEISEVTKLATATTYNNDLVLYWFYIAEGEGA